MPLPPFYWRRRPWPCQRPWRCLSPPHHHSGQAAWATPSTLLTNVCLARLPSRFPVLNHSRDQLVAQSQLPDQNSACAGLQGVSRRLVAGGRILTSKACGSSFDGCRLRPHVSWPDSRLLATPSLGSVTNMVEASRLRCQCHGGCSVDAMTIQRHPTLPATIPSAYLNIRRWAATTDERHIRPGRICLHRNACLVGGINLVTGGTCRSCKGCKRPQRLYSLACLQHRAGVSTRHSVRQTHGSSRSWAPYNEQAKLPSQILRAKYC
ncbi:hypothetical protein BKA66DRAFT_93703 [Pyrenochaeta sp. MPI-SDFR-AT-0127]|nr:hypothetical protein BKA66DRAFT_93703 [Pyrenochaeta sp. MPI-SDFR-AT-0127]